MEENVLAVDPANYTLDYIKIYPEKVDFNSAFKYAPFDVILGLTKTEIPSEFELFWTIVSSRDDLTKDFIIQNADYLEWSSISRYTSLDIIEELISRFNEDLDWNGIFYRELTEDFIRKYEYKLKSKTFCFNFSYLQNFSDQFFIDFNSRISWVHFCMHNLKEEFIEKYKDKLNWQAISMNSTLSEDFIRRNQKLVDWSLISRHQILSDSFKEEFKERLTFELIEIREAAINVEDYTKEYIDRYFEYLNWYSISNHASLVLIDELAEGPYSENIQWVTLSYRILEESFVRKHAERLQWNGISRKLKQSRFSKEFYEDFENKINWEIFLIR